MITDHDKAQALPFECQPDPRFLFGSRQHRSALTALEKGLVAGGGFTVLTGEKGTGKTALLDFVVSRLDPGRYIAAKLVAAPLEPDELIREVAKAFGQACPGHGGAGTSKCLTAYFLQLMRAGMRPVLLIDQCERLSSASLQEVIRLADAQVRGDKVLHIVLFGRTRLRQTLADDLPSLFTRHRVGGHHLRPLECSDARGLIEHRLRLAGRQGDPEISDGAFEMIFIKTGGVPGRITPLCASLVQYARKNNRHAIGTSVVRQISNKLRQGGT